MSAELITFLRARLDDDEAVLRSCAGGVPRWRAEDIAIFGPDLSPEVRAHIARHDPARVLKEIEAKREVVRLYERAYDYAPTFTSGFAAAMEDALLMFALAYADHPDYREEWRP